ncbi:glutamyl-tRNA(Gln) amidotransferase subunit C, mitochondrial [Nylanderia fulva]|uniref:glutamyl-tRNA(Gln) amidotransferase subunit C, mitochondrial n=1 Tax=Nylanderia fulva TaxID=613905 RepID=UPI0010FB16D2|nr:glutamyl-tRNA(Gln) amidotransferase subunit C, mitochondrial [Nylanderia fulva]
MGALQQTYRLFSKSVRIPLHSIAPSKKYHSSIILARHQQPQEVVENIRNRSSCGDKRPVIDEATVRRLERLALVGFEYEQSKRILEEAVAFAERLREARIDESVRPMYSTLENSHIRLREDVARSGIERCEILRNAQVLEEEYFVAPLTTNRSSESGR